MILAK